jgi:LCT (Lysosomal Cystine Transporter) family transporter
MYYCCYYYYCFNVCLLKVHVYIYIYIDAVLLTGITIFQCFIYERGNQVVSWTARILFAIMMLIIGVFLFLTFADVTSWLLMMNCLGYIKLSISFFKYVPQAWLNYKRKMTIGWSIGQILLDLTGGLLSFAQMFLDAINTNDWSSFKGGNIPKLGLSCLTIIFDLIFIIQHYILYRNNNKIHYENQKAEKSGLLPTLVNEIDDHQQIPADINDEKKNDEEQPILQNDNLRSKLQKSAMLDSEP